MLPMVTVGSRVDGYWVEAWRAGDEDGTPVGRVETVYGDSAWRLYATREAAEDAASAVMAETEGRYLAAVYAGTRPAWAGAEGE